jgi:hypothetical protein
VLVHYRGVFDEGNMRKFGIGSIGLVTTLLVVSLSGCGKETVGVNPPAILSTSPINGAVGVPVTQIVTATFSEGMNPSTITTSTFSLSGPGGTTIAGSVSYAASSSIASFTPAVSLAYHLPLSSITFFAVEVK